MALIVRKARSQECWDDFLDQFKANDARAHTKHVHLIMLDTLVSRISIMAHTSIDPFHLVRSNTCPDT